MGGCAETKTVCQTVKCGKIQTRTVGKSDYYPALVRRKHMAGIFDEKCREKEKYREQQIGKCPFSIPRYYPTL